MNSGAYRNNCLLKLVDDFCYGIDHLHGVGRRRILSAVNEALMYHDTLFKRNTDKAAAFVKTLKVGIGYADTPIFTHELTDDSCIGCADFDVTELIGAK